LITKKKKKKKNQPISSIASDGHIRVTAVPRHTTSPRCLVWSKTL